MEFSIDELQTLKIGIESLKSGYLRVYDGIPSLMSNMPTDDFIAVFITPLNLLLEKLSENIRKLKKTQSEES